ncbi:MATE family efflux transporter [Blautia obeum]|uniref:MATE family efflux transporter n=1 Tax=Blautia obeum TaxID=40520 RepID=UPI003CFC93DB
MMLKLSVSGSCTKIVGRILVERSCEHMSNTEGALTKGPILNVLARLALPIMASAFLSTAYSIMDMAWVGQLGGEVLAGVGVGSMYIWMSQGVVTLPRMGGQVYMAQELGRGNRREAQAYAAAAVQLCVILGIFFGLVCGFLTEPLVSFFQLEHQDAVNAAHIYIKIACGWILFSFLGLVLTGLYTAQGDSKTPLKANFTGLMLNMLLDPVLILGLGPFPALGAAGAAIATVLSQMIVVGVLVAGMRLDKSEANVLRSVNYIRKIEASYMKCVCLIGGPSAIQGIVYCMISMLLSRMAGIFGDIAIAVLRVGGQVESISWNVANGFSSAMNAFAAQNYGAGKMDRVRKGYRISVVSVLVWGGLISVVFLLFPREISRIFFHQPDEIAISSHYLMIIGLGEAFMCLELMSVGAISGLGNTKLCSIISITFTAIRLPIAWILSKTALGSDGIWWAFTISSVLKGLIFWKAFYVEASKKERFLHENSLIGK